MKAPCRLVNRHLRLKLSRLPSGGSVRFGEVRRNETEAWELDERVVAETGDRVIVQELTDVHLRDEAEPDPEYETEQHAPAVEAEILRRAIPPKERYRDKDRP